MTPTFEKVQGLLRQLPGIGPRSAERIALHLLVERPAQLAGLIDALNEAMLRLHRCSICGNLAEEDICAICADTRRNPDQLCIVEQVTDLIAMERSGAYRGLYHVLHGKLSPLHKVGPAELNFQTLSQRLKEGMITLLD